MHVGICNSLMFLSPTPGYLFIYTYTAKVVRRSVLLPHVSLASRFILMYWNSADIFTFLILLFPFLSLPVHTRRSSVNWTWSSFFFFLSSSLLPWPFLPSLLSLFIFSREIACIIFLKSPRASEWCTLRNLFVPAAAAVGRSSTHSEIPPWKIPENVRESDCHFAASCWNLNIWSHVYKGDVLLSRWK